MVEQILRGIGMVIMAAFGLAVTIIIILLIINYVIDWIKKPKDTAKESWEGIKDIAKAVGKWFAYAIGLVISAILIRFLISFLLSRSIFAI